jgi:hypothetical protein
MKDRKKGHRRDAEDAERRKSQSSRKDQSLGDWLASFDSRGDGIG